MITHKFFLLQINKQIYKKEELEAFRELPQVLLWCSSCHGRKIYANSFLENKKPRIKVFVVKSYCLNVHFPLWGLYPVLPKVHIHLCHTEYLWNSLPVLLKHDHSCKNDSPSISWRVFTLEFFFLVTGPFQKHK